MELARHDRSIPLQAKAIAMRQGIPSRFIEQILQALKQAGIVRSLRGPQGGYTLTQDPNQISLAELVNSMNGTEATPSSTNGSTDQTAQGLASLAEEDAHVRVVFLRRNFGKSAALSVGFREVRGHRVITMDGDLQNDPRDIPNFLAELDKGFDIVVGWRHNRQD